MIDVSILIPVYNVRDYIEKCLESVTTQTYKGSIQCIVVDDCGNDGSISLAEDYISHYKGPVYFSIIHHDHNRGLAAARNTAVAAAQGQFVFHLDSDDWLEPMAIELLVNKQRLSGADIISGCALKHTNDGVQKLVEPKYSTSLEMVRNTIELTLDHVIWRRLIRKSLYTDNNISAVEGVNIGEDHHTLPRLAYYANTIVQIDDVVYHYNCLNPNSYMSQRTKKFNIKRYESDIASINILSSFFADKDSYCASRLSEIKMQYQKNCLFSASILMDSQSHRRICTDAGFDNCYVFDVCKAQLHRVSAKLKRIFGNVKQEG